MDDAVHGSLRGSQHAMHSSQYIILKHKVQALTPSGSATRYGLWRSVGNS